MSFLFYSLILISILLVFVVFVYLFQEKIIFLNGDKLVRDYKYQFSNKFEEVFIKTDGDNEINALHFKLENPKGVILFCHGNKGNLQKWGERVSYFLDYNYDVLVFDYRNYGKSTGKFIEERMYNDALLTYNYLIKKYKENTIVVYGFSLGGTFATRIAALNKPKELILEAPFFNFKKAVQFISKFAPFYLLKYKFKSDDDIVKVTAPITVFHGNNDKVTSFDDAIKLLELNTSIKNEFIAIDGGTHHNIKAYSIYKQKLQEILQR